MTDQPIHPKAADGIYPRCVWCNGEDYALAVLDYSAGITPCAAAIGCGKHLPPEYVKAKPDTDDDPAEVVREIDENHQLEGWISDELFDRLTMGDRVFRVGDRKFRLAYEEEVPELDCDDPSLIFIDPKSGRRVEVEFEVFVRDFNPPAPPTDDKPPVDPNQLVLE